MFFMHWDRTQLFIGCVPWQGALKLNFHGSTLRSRLLAPETDILPGFFVASIFRIGRWWIRGDFGSRRFR